MGAYPTINLNDSTPSSTSGYTNVTWQSSTSVHSPNIANVTAQVPNLKASGTGHQGGLVPDPGAVAGTTKFLREDATWAIPGGGGGMTYAADTGTANAIVVAPGMGTIVAGSSLLVKIAATNTGATTIAVDGAGAVAVQRNGSALNAGDMATNLIYLLTYDGAHWQLVTCLDALMIGGSTVKDPMTPSDGDVLSYVSSSTRWENKAPSALSGFNASKIQNTSVDTLSPRTGDVMIYDRVQSKWVVKDFSDFKFWGMRPNGSGSFNTMGISNPLNNGGIGVVLPTATNSTLSKFTTSSTVGSSAGWQQPNASNYIFSYGSQRRFSTRLRLEQTANMRIWIGITSQAVVSVFRTDTPATNFVGFRYSTAAGDTKYQCVTQTSAVLVTRTAESGASHVDTALHTFSLEYDGSSTWYFYIDDVLVGQSTTNLPTNTTTCTAFVYIDNVGGAFTPAFSVSNAGGVEI